MAKRPLTVQLINNVIRRRHLAYYQHEQTITPIIKARRHGGVFQVQQESNRTWHDADPSQVFVSPLPTGLLLGENEISTQTRTARHNLEIAFYLARRTGCGTATEDVRGPWEHALANANRWSEIGTKPAAIFSTQEAVRSSFTPTGEMNDPLLCAWRGDFAIIQSYLQAVELQAVAVEPAFSARWSRLLIYPESWQATEIADHWACCMVSLKNENGAETKKP